MKIKHTILKLADEVHGSFDKMIHYYLATESDNGMFYLVIGFFCFESRIAL